MEDPAGLADVQRRTLDRLKTEPLLSGFHLVGGSAIAWHLGHRVSLDLDLFSTRPDVELEPIRERLVALGAEVITATPSVLRVRLDGELVDIVRYPYAPLDPLGVGASGFPVAGLRDLAAMKLAAIARRGIRRDFWDLHEIVTRGLPLEDVGEAYRLKFGTSENDLYQAARALTYFVDAEAERVIPRGLEPEHWQRIKAFFEREAPALVREHRQQH